MLQLFLLRHADAPHRGQNGQHMDDDERRLSPRGIKDAHNLGKYMRDHEYPAPETVLCSAALRTRQTAQYLYEGWNISPHTECCTTYNHMRKAP